MIEVTKYYSPNCGPCRVAGAALDKLKDDFAGKPVEFKSIDVTQESYLAQLLGITTVPVVLVTQDAEEKSRLVGCKRYSEYRNAVENALGA
jgi:thioredoxin-like negative regulator of GroEL